MTNRATFNRIADQTVTNYEMKRLISLAIPEESYNLIKNPSFEESTTGYTFTTCTGARVTGEYCRGSYLLKLTPTSPSLSHVQTTVIASKITASRVYTFSLDARGKEDEIYTIEVFATGGATLAFKQGTFKAQLPTVRVVIICGGSAFVKA